ncbi:tetratricopeptide repeat protein [Segetibacter sp. 3557_3]|uniref:tetratricopeptide repeat protein n=1 Tax=Segetibacter sp. 3557_3 TaxID=2547429 RepID=UPI001058B677|nr:tetratricopeptide repeat protein [Segetibacter sp. 3557_3]TDH21472.1 tetratricopeptide repeat protein [Segetibacter sp. 3557_3]
MKTFWFAAVLLTMLSACTDQRNNNAADRSTEEQRALVVALQEQVKQYPDSAGARMRLVNAMDSLGMYKEAIAHTDSMIIRDSLNNGLWFARGQLQESNEDTQQAIESYRKAISIYPSVESQLSLANLYAERADPRALAICTNVAKMGLGRESDAHSSFIAGVYYARKGDAARADSLFDQCINNDYTYMEAYMEKGFIRYDSKDYPSALQVFQRAITVNNTYADAYYWQAKTYEAMGNKQEAILNYQRALGLDKNLSQARAALTKLE